MSVEGKNYKELAFDATRKVSNVADYAMIAYGAITLNAALVAMGVGGQILDKTAWKWVAGKIGGKQQHAH